MNDRQDSLIDRFGTRAGRWLDRGAHDLSERTVQRLSAARSVALGRVAEDGRPLLELAPSGASGTRSGRRPRARWALALAVLVVASALVLTNEWQRAQSSAELAEIDAMILSDDLPIDAAADPGFVRFLTHDQ